MAERANLRFSVSLSIDLGLIDQEFTIHFGGGSARGDRSEVKEEE